ncbi:hypothetical protein BC829DRAFT_449236 [Chytridium lagenaria]|nr:hypothetical protein BC829DRAFT_449236 [Chytridium lagenaria]
MATECERLSIAFPISLRIAGSVFLDSCCTINGISCDDNGNVIAIRFPNISFRDYILPPIANLTSLARIDLKGNSFLGPIPKEIALLQRLEYLDLSSNSLVGAIPTEIWSIKGLKFLDVSGNRLNGTIPSEVSNLVSAESLNLSQNNFSGALPSSLGSIADLALLDVSSNQFTGTLPEELGNLRTISHHYAGITGEVPERLGNENLKSLLLRGNVMYGRLPPFVYNVSDYTIDGNCFRDGEINRELTFGANTTQRPLPICQSILGSSWPTIAPPPPSPRQTSPSPSSTSIPPTSISFTILNLSTPLSISLLASLLILLLLFITITAFLILPLKIPIKPPHVIIETEKSLPIYNPVIPLNLDRHPRNVTYTYVSPNPAVSIHSTTLHPSSTISHQVDRETSVLRLPSVDDGPLEKRGTLWGTRATRNEGESGNRVTGIDGDGEKPVTSTGVDGDEGEKPVTLVFEKREVTLENDVAGWSLEQVLEWLMGAGIAPQIVDLLKLMEMGVASSTARNVILHAVEGLRMGTGTIGTRTDLPPLYS